MIKNKFLLAQLALVLTTMIWGFTFTIVQESLTTACPPYAFSGYRFGIAALGCFFLLDFKNITFSKQEITGGIICGLFLFIGYAFQNYGLMHTTPTKSAFITGTSIIMVPIILVIMRLQNVSFKIWISSILATIGMYFLLNPKGNGLEYGDILTFGCALGFAIHLIFQDKFTKKSRTMFLFFPQLVTVSVLSFLFNNIFETQEIIWTNQLLLSLSITGILATLFGIGTMVWAQKIISPSRTAIIFSMEPLFAAVFAMAVIGEFLTIIEWFGGSLIILGVLYSELGSKSK
tara:strand:+ start:490 stop:1356 length:867 start_codon:yes stop_codon:yes gene_type:complete